MNNYRKLVMQADLNPAGKLFGGRLLALVDECAAMYAMCQLRTRSVVTANFSESNFKEPVHLGDFLEFNCHVIEFGKSSIRVGVTVETKDLAPTDVRRIVFTAQVVLVSIGVDGKSKRHGITEERDE